MSASASVIVSVARSKILLATQRSAALKIPVVFALASSPSTWIDVCLVSTRLGKKEGKRWIREAGPEWVRVWWEEREGGRELAGWHKVYEHNFACAGCGVVKVTGTETGALDALPRGIARPQMVVAGGYPLLRRWLRLLSRSFLLRFFGFSSWTLPTIPSYIYPSVRPFMRSSTPIHSINISVYQTSTHETVVLALPYRSDIEAPSLSSPPTLSHTPFPLANTPAATTYADIYLPNGTTVSAKGVS